MSMLILTFVLILIAITLVVVDMFIPTGGIFVILAAIASVAAVILGFKESTLIGGTALLMILLAIPLLFGLFIKIYPRTKIGREMMVEPEHTDAYDFGRSRQTRPRVGDTAITATSLTPSGRIKVGDELFDATSDEGIIAAGTAVQIIHSEMGLLTVIRHIAEISPQLDGRLQPQPNSENQVDLAGNGEFDDQLPPSRHPSLLEMDPSELDQTVERDA